jgi:hypothetical protein
MALQRTDAEEEPVVNGNVNMMNLESDIQAASSILSGSRVKMPPSPEEGSHNLALYCYLAQLLNVGKRSIIAATVSLVFNPASGNVQADVLVSSTNSPKSENTNRKDTKLEWKFKDLEANESLEANEVKDAG